LPNREGILALVRTLNRTLGETALNERILDTVFETYWPQFKEKFTEVIQSTESQSPAKPRSEKDILAEILENTGDLNSLARRLELEIEQTSMKNGDSEWIMDTLRNRRNNAFTSVFPSDALLDGTRIIRH
jgi:hypothetical protein